MVKNQIAAIRKFMGTWLVPGLLILGLILLSGCGGGKNKPAPVEQQPASSQSAGQTAGEPSQPVPEPASTPAEAPAETQNPPAQKQAAKDQGDTTPLPKSSPAATPQDTPPKKEPAAGTAQPEEKIYSFKAGDYFPPFSLSALNGNTYSEELFTTNKVTLVNFWATFCGPCIREMPDLEQLRQQYAAEGLGVVGIVLDSKKAGTAKSMATKLGTTYPHLLDDGRFAPYFYAVPQTFLVDRKGKILGVATGARTLEQFAQMIRPHL